MSVYITVVGDCNDGVGVSSSDLYVRFPQLLLVAVSVLQHGSYLLVHHAAPLPGTYRPL